MFCGNAATALLLSFVVFLNFQPPATACRRGPGCLGLGLINHGGTFAIGVVVHRPVCPIEWCYPGRPAGRRRPCPPPPVYFFIRALKPLMVPPGFCMELPRSRRKTNSVMLFSWGKPPVKVLWLSPCDTMIGGFCPRLVAWRATFIVGWNRSPGRAIWGTPPGPAALQYPTGYPRNSSCCHTRAH